MIRAGRRIRCSLGRIGHRIPRDARSVIGDERRSMPVARLEGDRVRRVLGVREVPIVAVGAEPTGR